MTARSSCIIGEGEWVEQADGSKRRVRVCRIVGDVAEVEIEIQPRGVAKSVSAVVRFEREGEHAK
jgi:hypothetical protein